MNWQEAIQKSKKGTAMRVEEKNGKRYTTIKYKDGSGFLMVGEKMRVDFSNSREATSKELNGFTDWQPRPQCKNGNPNCHHQRAPRGSKTGTQGRKGSYERSIIPRELCLEVLSSACR